MILYDNLTTTQRAWNIARKIAEERGGQPKDYFGEAMSKSIKFTYQEADKARETIQELKEKINDMTTSSYTPTEKSFKGGKIRDKGTRAKEWSRDRIYETIDAAVDELGELRVAQNIEKNGDILDKKLERLVFAIYDKKYARWGSGGYPEYMNGLIVDVRQVVRGE